MVRRKKSRKRSLQRLHIILLAAFGMIALIGLAILIIGILNGNLKAPQTDIVALVNGERISAKELDSSYQNAIPKPYQEFVSKWQFLNESVIAQKLLFQEAQKMGFLASQSEFEESLEALLEESNLTQQQLDDELLASGLEGKDLEATLRARITILKYVNATILQDIFVSKKEVEKSFGQNQFSEHNISLDEAYAFLEQQLLVEKQSQAVLALIERLRENASITLFIEQAERGITSFEKKGDKICSQNGSIKIRMFISTSCKECKPLASRLTKLLNEYGAENITFAASIWLLDTGDNLLTKEKEYGVPQLEVEFFKRLSPESKVPAYSFGCLYTRIGHLPGAQGNLNAEEKEFNSVIDTLLYDNG